MPQRCPRSCQMRIETVKRRGTQMRRKLRKRLWLSAGVLPFLLTACQMVPVEEELPQAPVIQSYEIEEYQQTAVKRGDIYLEKTVHCKYVPANRELLSFPLGGEYIDQVYVMEGQTVQKGELLAELVKSDLEQQIEQREYSLKVLRLKKQQAEELRVLAVAKMEVSDAGAVQIAETNEKYLLQIQGLEDSIYIEELRLEELKENLRKRQIYAGINGTVTYLRQSKNGDRSVEGQLFVTLADMDSIAFTVDGEDAAYFPVGTEAIIKSNSKEYAAIVVKPETLGLAATDEQVAYLQLLQPDPTIEDGASGTIKVVLDVAEDALYLEKKAVKASEGRYYVSVLDEEGWKVTREVKAGLVTNDYIEITEGLKEGDPVIVE